MNLVKLMIFKKPFGKTNKNSKSNDRGSNDQNREIQVILYIFLALFLSMIVYLLIFVYKDSKTVINSSYNKRIDILSKHVYRGQILASDNTPIAKTIIDEYGNEKRVYPYGRLFSHAGGYVSNGGLGIESICAYTLLTSNDDFLTRITNDLAGEKNMGNTVVTTLDPLLSFAAYEAMGDIKGAAVVSDVKTGGILAIVSKPDFDPNTIGEYWDYYNSEQDAATLLNRATQGLYPPGSTFKIVSAYEYLKENNNSFEEYVYECNGHFDYEDARINCYHGQNHGQLDFTESFAKSCNSSFANISLQFDRKEFNKTCESLMFNSSIPCPFTVKESVVDPGKSNDYNSLLQTGIGQGMTEITPFHMNLITAAIANGGVLMTPYVVDKVLSPKGEILTTTRASVYDELLEEKYADTLSDLMREVVLSGTGTRLRDDVPYKAAGKTGSAEYSNEKSRSHAWFTGFAPIEDPQIAVTVIVEDGGSGGETAVPIARRIFNAYFE